MKKTDDLIIQLEEILERALPLSFCESPSTFRIMPPLPVSDIFSLQAVILSRASKFNIHGDIEIDEGHSFTY